MGSQKEEAQTVMFGITVALAGVRMSSEKKTYGYLEPDESKRQTFIEQLASLADEMIVYVHEAGMDNREHYGYGWNLRPQRFHALKSGRRLSSSEYDCCPVSGATDGSVYCRRSL